MADHFYGVNLGDEMAAEVSTGTSTTSKTFEFRITDGVTGTTKLAAVKALKSILAYIERNGAPA
jgi:hypothetical protein